MDATGNLDGHLGEGTEVTGTLRFEGSVRIDGTFSGKIISPATLILGPSAKVNGELQVAQLAVHGGLQGTVHARDLITIHSSGKVEADLKTKRLVIEPGAFFQGKCDMEREPAAKPKVAAASTEPRGPKGAEKGVAPAAGPADSARGATTAAAQSPAAGAQPPGAGKKRP